MHERQDQYKGQIEKLQHPKECALRRAKQVPEIANKSIPYSINRGGKGTVTKLNSRDEILSMLLTHEGMEEKGALVKIFEEVTFKLQSKK
jgi:hypothetical protein